MLQSLAVAIFWALPAFLYVSLCWHPRGRGERIRSASLKTTHPSLKVRIADYTSADAKSIRLLLNAYAEDPMGDGESLPIEVQENIVPELSKVPGAFSVLAMFEDTTVGLCNCFTGFSTFKCKPLINIHDCYVHPDYRGLGVVDAMLSEVERISLDRGACKITLEVLSKNMRAQRAYRRNGFDSYQLDPRAGHALFWQKVIVPRG